MLLPRSFHLNVLPVILAISVLSVMLSAAGEARSASEFGRVNMQGSIIDTPCAIATDDLHQSIDMKVTTLGEMFLFGRGAQQTFSLNLVNCDLTSHDQKTPDRTRFSTTFDGPSKNGLFSISGATGMGIQILDTAGNVAIPGQPLPSGSLISGTQNLEYTLRLVRNDQPLKAGNYHAILRFKVDYF